MAEFSAEAFGQPNLIGTDGAATVSTEQVAERADLSPYELLVGLALRVPSRPLASSPS